VFGNHRLVFICNLLIFTYKGTNNKRDYQLFKCFSYPELAYIYVPLQAKVERRKAKGYECYIKGSLVDAGCRSDLGLDVPHR
ncbi:hypothetical protein, partial [Prevotella brunnea]|uniref:hypothetical protein n=3 Tax=Prevotella TaxID=838 RepID=UPI00283A8F99